MVRLVTIALTCVLTACAHDTQRDPDAFLQFSTRCARASFCRMEADEVSDALDSYDYVGNFNTDGGRVVHLFLFSHITSEHPGAYGTCRHGATSIVYHDSEGRVLASSRCWGGSSPMKLDGRLLITEDKVAHDLGRAGFVEWVGRGRPVQDYVFFGMTDEEFQNYK